MFDEILSGFRDKFQERVTCVAFASKFAKANQKIAEISEICENYSLLFITSITHLCPYSDPLARVQRVQRVRRHELHPARVLEEEVGERGLRELAPVFFRTPT